MSNKALALIHAVSPTSQDLGFRDRSKEHPKDFTRDRKVGFVGVLSMILNLARRTTPIEWDPFRERWWPYLELGWLPPISPKTHWGGP